MFAEVVEGIDVVDSVLEGDAIESIREVAPQAGGAGDARAAGPATRPSR